jgi:hypothetical protein
MVSADDPLRPFSRPDFTRTLVESTSLEPSLKVLHKNTRTNFFTRTLTRNASLEHMQKVFPYTTRTKHFTRTLAESSITIIHVFTLQNESEIQFVPHKNHVTSVK